MRLILLAFILVLTGCPATAPQVKPRKNPSEARIAIQVRRETVLSPSLDETLPAELRQQILWSRVGAPTEDFTGADLLLKVVITAGNFGGSATQWQWQLLDAKSGDTLIARTDTATFGAAPDVLAAMIIREVAALELPKFTRAPANPPPVRPTNPVEDPTRWAVIIGIERYREGLNPALGAEADARALAEVAHRALGVPEANIKLLIGDRATRADLSGALLEWLPRNAVQPGGRVYVFFSGHGAPDPETGEAYLVPYDANPSYLKSGGLPLSQLQATLGALRNQQVYLFLDACFSGQGERSVLAAGTRPLVPVRAITAPPWLITLAAAGAAETTATHPDSGHGLFTHHLLAALGGAADTDENRVVTLDELHGYVVRLVRLEARRQNRDQTPTLAVPPGYDVQAPLVRSGD